MENTKSLKGQKYRAVIVDKHDPTTQGRYAVFCYELHHQASENPNDDYIWAKNRVHNYRLGAQETFYGQYHPLHPNQNCYINFETNDINSAYISELIDDVITKTITNTLPFNLSINDRDEVTVISKTLNNHHSILITEATSVAPQSIQIVYGGGVMCLVFDGTGVTLKATNLNVLATNVNIKSAGNFNVEAAAINLKGPITCETVTSGKITGSITYAEQAGSLGGSPPATPSVPAVAITEPVLIASVPAPEASRRYT